MAEVEFTVPHSKLQDPQTVTQVNVSEMKKRGFDVHKDEIVKLEDDHDRGVRFYRVRSPRRFFFMGGKGR